jgi:hypothetical protein
MSMSATSSSDPLSRAEGLWMQACGKSAHPTGRTESAAMGGFLVGVATGCHSDSCIKGAINGSNVQGPPGERGRSDPFPTASTWMLAGSRSSENYIAILPDAG